MFLVLNKNKIASYIIALSTVIILFCVASVMMTYQEEAIETSGYANRQLPIYNVKMEEKKIALTINCAWTADDIDIILKTLEKHQSKITFFMVGTWIEKYPEEVKKIAAAGHEIANHSETHPHVNQLSYEKNVEQIKKCNDRIKALTGNDVKLYRGPYGEYNDTVIKAAKSLNMQVIQWNIDSLDYKGLTGKEMLSRINEKLSSGSIILMHSGAKYTGETLDMILTGIKSQGYEIVKVSDLIYQDNFTIDNNGTQIKNK